MSTRYLLIYLIGVDILLGMQSATTSAQRVISADQAIGMTLNQAMFDLSVSRSELARRMEMSQPSVSMKLRGQVRWSAEEVLLAALVLGLDVRDIMPTHDEDGGWIPAVYVPGKAKAPTEVEASLGSYAIRDSNPGPTD